MAPKYGPKEEAFEKSKGTEESKSVEALEERRNSKHAQLHPGIAAEVAKAEKAK
jgi:hypothetical protein